MLNEENMEYYEEEVDENGSSMHQGGSSTTDVSGEINEGDCEDDEYGEEDFCCKYRK